MNKRGITFTYVSLLFLVIILFLFSIYTKSKTRAETEVTTAVAENLDIFIKEMDSEYLPAAIRTSSNRAVLGLENEIKTRGSYLSGNAQKCIANVLVDGVQESSFCNSGSDSWIWKMNDAGVNYTLESIARQLEQLATLSGITLRIEDIDANRILVHQKDAWNLGVKAEIFYSVSNDVRNITWARRKYDTEVLVPITEFYSPAYLVYGKTDDKEVMITKHPEEHIFPLDAVEFGDALNNRYFYENAHAPTFLAMLGGDFVSQDEKGISSFVHKNNYLNTGKSWTDYNYFARGELYVNQNCIIPVGAVTPPGDPKYCFSAGDWAELFSP